MTAAQSLPLQGVRVVEFTHMVMGPTCGMILADLGAEVIKVEPPGGDKTRKLPGLGIGFFRTFNRNKKSVVLDIDTPAGPRRGARADRQRRCRSSRTSARAAWRRSGWITRRSSKRFPRLIYVAHKGFLPGPYEHRLALDEVVQMMGGLSYMTGPPGRPLRAGTSVNDIMGGMFGAIGVLAALQERHRTGKGQEIQSALFENCVFLSSQHMQQFAMTGEAAAADACARVGVERLRRVPARGRRAVRRRGERQAMADAVQGARAPRPRGRSGTADERAARARSARRC